jgi:hypothetical protein
VADFQFMTVPVIVGTMVALGDSIGGPVMVDDALNAETIAREVNAVTFGLVTAA